MKQTEPLLFRKLLREELECVWTIDRREVIDNVYYLEDGELVLKPEYYDMRSWPPGAQEVTDPILEDCFERGGTFFGAFDEGQLVGVAVLDNEFMGKERDQLQLVFLHVSRDYRGRGLGRSLFERALERARELNAQRLYISATPSENTVDFYRHLGCEVAEEVDEALFAMEPEDIHMEYRIPPASETDS
jgi:predicted N-acetyltransferase YhbS